MAVSQVLLLLTALLVCVSLSSAATELEEVDIVPGHDNECWVVNKNRFYDSGATWSEPGCLRGICKGSGTQIERHSCGKIPSCKLKHKEVDKNADYPACCPSPICLYVP